MLLRQNGINAKHGHGTSKQGGRPQDGVMDGHNEQKHHKHHQRVQQKFTDSNLRDASAHALHRQTNQTAPNHKQRQGTAGLRKQIDSAT